VTSGRRKERKYSLKSNEHARLWRLPVNQMNFDVRTLAPGARSSTRS
jgi:hypothetical protein